MLDTTPINWYLQAKLRLTTTNWEGMTQNFVTTFLFESQYPSVDQVLQIVRKNLFEEASSLPLEQEEDEWTVPLQKLQDYYNINVDEDDDPRKVNITKTEGQRDIEGPGVELPFIIKPIKIKKFNIGTEETPKLSNVGDYWDVSTIEKIIELLHEYQDYYRACDACQQVGKPSKRDEMTLAPQMTLQEFEKWTIDFMGPINPLGNHTGARYIITAKEYLTRWAEAREMKDCSENTTACFIFDDIIRSFV
jgi:hypothetical protein